ncbi:MAG: hypothetical protein M3135_02915, partial [Actinomycetota bacterium]|nr:hypothetical protein [Actinomycetota bacterium]
MSVHPSLFSPNGDGRLEETTITVEVDLPSTVEIQVRDGAGTVHRTWTEAATPEDPASVVWDGRGEGGAIPDGGYEVFAHDAEPVQLNGQGTAPVALDTQEPSFDWMGTRPRVLEREKRVRFRFRAHDPSGPLTVTVETEDPGG